MLAANCRGRAVDAVATHIALNSTWTDEYAVGYVEDPPAEDGPQGPPAGRPALDHVKKVLTAGVAERTTWPTVEACS